VRRGRSIEVAESSSGIHENEGWSRLPLEDFLELVTFDLELRRAAGLIEIGAIRALERDRGAKWL
jgi:hypothetical protein